MAVKSFNDYVLYKAKTIGVSKGGFYKLKTPKSNDQAFLIKQKDVEGIVSEYVASNIAHLLLGDKAPKVDLAVSQEDGKTVVRTVSYLLNNFKSLDELRQDFGTSQQNIVRGFIIDKNGKILPKDVYTETELAERAPIKIVPALLRDEEEINIALELVGNKDAHTGNRGAIKIGDNFIAAIVDFDWSLKWHKGSKVDYCLVAAGSFSDLKKITKFVSKLVASQDEIMDLLEQLFADMKSVGLEYDFTKIKFGLLGKFNAYVHELAILEASVSIVDGIATEASSNILSDLKNVDLSLVSSKAKEFLISSANKLGLIDVVKEALPSIVSEKVTEDKSVEFTSNDLKFAVRYGNKKKFEEVLQSFEDKYKDYSKDNHDYNIQNEYGDAFVASVVTDRKYYFDKLLPLADYRLGGKVDCRWRSPELGSTITKAIYFSITSNNSEIFDKLAPLCPNLLGPWAGWMALFDNKNLFESLIKKHFNCVEVDCTVAEPIEMKRVFEEVVRGENRGMIDLMVKYGMPLTEARTAEIKKVWPDFNTQTDNDLVGNLNTASFATEL